MEAVGAAASVAGILGFAGQSLNGIIAIKSCLQAIKDAPRVAEIILGDIKSLESVLTSIADLVNGFVREPPTDPRLAARISSLERDLKRCLDEVQGWRDDEALRQPTEGSLRTTLRRIKHAGYKDALEALARRVAAQKETLGFGLTALGRLNDQIAAEKNSRFEQELQQMSVAVDSLSDQVSSMATSLSSIASSLSSRMGRGGKSRPRQRFREIVPATSTNFPHEKESNRHWTCDALNGTDDAFEHRGAQGYSECNFCGVRFYWVDDDSFFRQGRHLVEKHGFGKCEARNVFHRKNEFLRHLEDYHGYAVGNRDSTQTDPDNSWIDSQFCRKGDAPETVSNLRRELNMANDSEANTHYLILQKLSSLLNSSGIILLEIPEVPRDGDQRRGTAPFWVRQLCISLAALDDSLENSVLNDRSDLCYAVGCLQEELLMLGFEDVLMLETYLSPSQRKIIQTISSSCGGLPSTAHRLKTGWLLRDHFDRFATLGDAFMHRLRSEHALSIAFESGKVNVTEAIAKGLVPVFRSSNSYLRASKSNTDKLESLSLRVSGQIQGEDREDRRRRRFRRIDNWLLGIFIHSISMRRILVSGKAVPGLASTNPTCWALELLEHWDSTVDPLGDTRSSGRPCSEDLSYLHGATFGGGSTTESSESISSPVSGEPVTLGSDTGIIDGNAITSDRETVFDRFVRIQRLVREQRQALAHEAGVVEGWSA